MAVRSIIYSFWIATLGLQVLLALVLVYRRMWQKFPFFSAYVFFNLVAVAIAYSVAGHGMAYFYTFWVCEGISTFLALAIVYELFRALFSSHVGLRKLAGTVFGVAILILIIIGLVVIFTQPQAQRTNIGSSIMVVAEAARVVEVGLLMFLFLFSTAFGLHWRAHVFGIALGLGVFAAVDLVNMTLRSYLGNSVADVLNVARVSAFCLSVVMWIVYLWASERATSIEQVPERAQLEQWNQAVMELINR